MKIGGLPPEERPREKLLGKGREYLSNSELLAILLGNGTKDKSAIQLAEELLSLDKRGLLFLSDCTPEELYAVKGMGKAKICTLMAAMELGKRVSITPKRERITITEPDDVASIFMEEMRYYHKEHFRVLMVNVKGEIIEQDNVAVGDICSTVVHPREVFSRAIRRSAAAVILVHNHPSGSVTPSEDDISTTERLVQAGKLLGIRVLDHIIIGDGIYTSLKKEGLMD